MLLVQRDKGKSQSTNNRYSPQKGSNNENQIKKTPNLRKRPQIKN